MAPRDQMVGTFDDSTVTEAVEEHLRTYPGKTFEGWKDDESHLTHMWSGIQGCEFGIHEGNFVLAFGTF